MTLVLSCAVCNDVNVIFTVFPFTGADGWTGLEGGGGGGGEEEQQRQARHPRPAGLVAEWRGLLQAGPLTAGHPEHKYCHNLTSQPTPV